MFSIQLQCASCRMVFRRMLPAPEEGFGCPACQALVPFPTAEPGIATWRVRRGTEQAGPFTLAQLKELAATGQLLGQDLVITEGADRGHLAASLPFLFPIATVDHNEPMLVMDDKPSLPAARVRDRRNSTDAEALSRTSSRKSARSLSLDLRDFRIIRKLGAGGMGTVFLAQQKTGNRPVALKVLSESLARKQNFVARFHREEKVLASLDHPGIIRFFGAGQNDGVPFFAMEYIDGFSAAVLLSRLGRFRVGDALFIVLRCADALRFAHERNIIHRDVKPENIMVTRLGHVKLADMGLAKSLREDLSLTDSGTSVGTPKYMAPEQARNAKKADHRSDIYALGGVLYHLLTGQVPFQGSNSMELMLAKEHGMFPSARQQNPDVPPRLDLVLDKMLAKDPRNRYQSCELLSNDLERLGLANENLQLNPLHVIAAAREESNFDLVEILMIHDDVKDILLVEQALSDNDMPSNLTVVASGTEALALLSRDDAPLPNLVILGRDVHASGSLELLRAINNCPRLRMIPLIVFAATVDTAAFLKKHGLEARLTVSRPEDLVHFEQLVQSVQGLCLTVAERLG